VGGWNVKTLVISIKNFRRYNPRNDRASHSWFRVENSIFASEDLHGLKPEQKWIWICLLCLASKKQAESFEVNVEWLADTVKISPKAIVSAIEALSKRMLVHYQQPTGTQLTSLGSPTDRQTDITNRQTNSIAQFALSDSDLEELYILYPRRIGKIVGFRKLRKDLQSLHDVEDFKKAVQAYKTHCEKEGLEEKFIKHFSTFANQWREWLDPAAGTSTVKPSGDINWGNVFGEDQTPEGPNA
jgi:hypothetical protein